jgi:hypothetical protein
MPNGLPDNQLPAVKIFPIRAARLTGAQSCKEHQRDSRTRFLLASIPERLHDCQHFVGRGRVRLCGDSRAPGNRGVPNRVDAVEYALILGVGEYSAQEGFDVLESCASDTVRPMHLGEQPSCVHRAKVPKRDSGKAGRKIHLPHALVSSSGGRFEIFLNEWQIVSLNVLRDGLRAFRAGSAFIYWAELFRQQRTNIGLGAVAVAHVGELS